MCLLLLFRRLKLQEGEGPLMKNEGVGIVLDERATVAWRKRERIERQSALTLDCLVEGCQCWAEESRRVNEKYPYFSYPSPTAKAPPTIAHKFMDDLQDMMDRIPLTDGRSS